MKVLKYFGFLIFKIFYCMLKPLSDRVILKAVQKESVTKSGIYIPEGASKEKPHMYEVVAVGPGKKDADMTIINVGDKVLCGPYSGDEVDYILAVVN